VVGASVLLLHTQTRVTKQLTQQDWKQIGDPILHIEFRRWADLVVIAPCSADFLAKLAAGFSDNLAVCTSLTLPDWARAQLIVINDAGFDA
jgi:phosphopantothenoylcysteine synthetase/decarboxylase